MGVLDDLYAEIVGYDDTLQVPLSGKSNVQTMLDWLKKNASGGSGVTPFYAFGKAGNIGAGTYLLGPNGIATSSTPALIPGNNTIVKLSISLSANTTGMSVVQIQRRTALGVLSDITNASMTVPSGIYKFAYILPAPVILNADEEIAVYNKSGATLRDPNFYVFVIPS